LTEHFTGFRPLNDEFWFMAIPTEADRLNAAKELDATPDESLDGDRSRFLLFLPDSTGNQSEWSRSGIQLHCRLLSCSIRRTIVTVGG
jgi:hypothetical protein